MRINERRIRQIIHQETRHALREGFYGDDFGGSAAEEDAAARWEVDNSGYNLVDAPGDVTEAWEAFKSAVRDLEPFMNDTFPDTESDGDAFTIGDAAVHQATTFLADR